MKVSNRLERLAGCATFFIHYDFEKDVRRFPQLGVAHADWYENVLKKQVTEFINAESLLRRRAMGKCFVDILRVLHERDDIVLPPIKVECDFKENDLCDNVEVCIRILQEVQDLEKRQSRQKESLQRSVFGVVCDQTAEATLVDECPDRKE